MQRKITVRGRIRNQYTFFCKCTRFDWPTRGKERVSREKRENRCLGRVLLGAHFPAGSREEDISKIICAFLFYSGFIFGGGGGGEGIMIIMETTPLPTFFSSISSLVPCFQRVLVMETLQGCLVRLLPAH